MAGRRPRSQPFAAVLLLSNRSGGQLLGGFLASPRLCGGGAWPGIVGGDEGYHLDVADWPGLAGVGRTEGEKMVARGCKVVWADTSGPLSGDLQLLRRWLLVVDC